MTNWLVPHLQAEIRPTDSVLDLCCGCGHVMGNVPCGFYVGIDIDAHQLDRYVAGPRKQTSIFIEADVISLSANWIDYPFDIAVCIDGIEHLNKPDAIHLLTKMECWAKKVIVVTPDDFFDNTHNDVTGEDWNGQHQLHKSLLTEREFVALRYVVRVKQAEVLGYNCMMYVKVTE